MLDNIQARWNRICSEIGEINVENAQLFVHNKYTVFTMGNKCSSQSVNINFSREPLFCSYKCTITLWNARTVYMRIKYYIE